MKKLHLSDAPRASCIERYLINNEKDLEDALDDTRVDWNLSATPTVFGKEDLPAVYPYILIVHSDQEHDYIDVNAVSQSDFNQEEDV